MDGKRRQEVKKKSGHEILKCGLVVERDGGRALSLTVRHSQLGCGRGDLT